MKIFCSYCRKEIGEKEPFEDDRISHGVCKECQDNNPKQIRGVPFNEYLEQFDAPVFIVDEHVRILAVNKRAEILLGKPKTNLLGLLGGEALECVNASTPEGCGNTVHCVTCSIRKAVTTTIESGILHRHIPVKLQREDGEIAMYLSTEIIGSSVCIKISSGK